MTEYEDVRTDKVFTFASRAEHEQWKSDITKAIRLLQDVGLIVCDGYNRPLAKLPWH